ncbi:MAG TPA: sulfurtransferase [Candidatus Competibacteraceae bacterium]|nr:sulfurtransferase [Candidatus Competibacteraceae bacterium]
MTAYQTLIAVEDLSPRLSDPDWVVVDCRFNLMDTEAGRRAYAEGHIPGAVYAHLDEDLSGPRGPYTGRHPLPDPSMLARRLGGWGIAQNSQVVAYDDSGGMFAARLWWLLRWLGHRAVAVLDGGLGEWRRRGLPLSKEMPAPQPRTFPLDHVDTLAWVDSAYVLENLKLGRDLVLDARAAPRYRGEMEPIDPVAGHVPGALNLPQDGNLGADGRFLPADALRRRFQEVLGQRAPETVLHMCGSGVTACHNLLAMEVAGLSGSRLYAGSWSEWIRDPQRPIARGEG